MVFVKKMYGTSSILSRRIKSRRLFCFILLFTVIIAGCRKKSDSTATIGQKTETAYKRSYTISKRSYKKTQDSGVSEEPITRVEPLTDVDSVVLGNSVFAFNLYQKLRSPAEENLVFSPYSVSTALAMVYAGARGETQSQMEKALQFSLGQEKLHPAFAELQNGLNKLQEAGNFSLYVANSLWPQQDYKFLDEYLSLAKKHYGVSITPVDYSLLAREETRKLINKWVEDKTEDKIKDLIPPGSFHDLTRLVLVNPTFAVRHLNRHF